MLAEEVAKLKPEQQVRTHMVRLLKSVAHVFVNDAFGAAHRSSPSLVGLAEVLPACAGRLMEREVRGLGKALSPEHPCLYVLGGAKFDDSLQIIEHVIKNGVADSILTGGLVGHAFLTVVGVDLGAANLEILRKHGYEEQAARAKDLAQRFAEKIMVPIDVVIEADGKPLTVDIAPTAHTCTIAELKSALERSPPPSIQHPIYDIGPKTVARYSELIRGAKTVVANGPLGVFERPGYERGTFGVLRAMADSQAYTVIGGGHIVAAAAAAGVTDRLSHVSTGGGAAITFLSGAPLPAVEALKRAARRVRA
jgi:phosphoglycerate kinase